jgi:hypothetical protein
MPEESERQRKAAGAALSAKRGGRTTRSLLGPAKQMVKMSEAQLRDFARKPKSPKPRTTSQAAGSSRSHRGARRSKPRNRR